MGPAASLQRYDRSSLDSTTQNLEDQSSLRAHVERSMRSGFAMSQDTTMKTVNRLGCEEQHQTRGPRRYEPRTDRKCRGESLT
jgi:hypothetical protein